MVLKDRGRMHIDRRGRVYIYVPKTIWSDSSWPWPEIQKGGPKTVLVMLEIDPETKTLIVKRLE